MPVEQVRQCRDCGDSFTHDQRHADLLARVSPKLGNKTYSLPLPTFCPICRNRRRMAWRNDRSFYLRPCSFSGNRIVAIYPENTPFPVYHPSVWYSDKWNAMDYGQDIDFSRPFFEQWIELMHKVPRLGVDIVNCENSDYCNYCGDDKNCYLDIAGEANEDCYFNLFTKYSKDCADCTFAYSSTLCYECINCHDCYDCRYSMYLENCANCLFSYDLIGCKNCLFCVNLRNKQYHIFNEPHSKSEYESKLNELRLTSNSSVEKCSQKWLQWRTEHGLYRDMYAINCENCSGNNIKNSKNCSSVFNATNCEDCLYLYDVLDAKDCSDLNYSLYNPECSYELISTLQMQYSAFNMASHYCANVFYCDLTNNSSDLFGCIGLNHGHYCILNKQYSKEDYESLIAKLIQHMTSTGEWGEFFPATASPSCYNETVAQEYLALSESKALEKGYRWKTLEDKDYKKQTFTLADDIADISPEITKEVLACTVCKRNYRIIQPELKLYQRQAIPIPRNCPDCRHQIRMGIRNPRKLWESACSGCGVAVNTTYAPGLPEKVYCERCYRAELY